MPAIKLPNNPAAPGGVWQPRPHQQAGWDYLLNGGTRLVECDHRRAGKDELALAWSAVAMHQKKPIAVWHLLPEAAQARKAIWDSIDASRGKKRIDLAFPPEIRKHTRNQEMQIEFKNGSTWQVLGSDNYDSLVGSQPTGIVFSEFGLANPYAWSYLRPILLENDGWAIFISTPRGRNHLHKLWQLAIREDNDWLAVMNKADETDVFTEMQLQEEKNEYIATYGRTMGKAMFDQEYLCSWESAQPGSYWGEVLNDLERDGRLTDVPYDPALPVITCDDLGINDSNVKFYLQVNGPQIRMIDVDVHRNVGIPTHVQDMNAKPWAGNYGQSIYPFDIEVRELGIDGRTRKSVLQNLNVRNVTVAPNPASVSRADGIDAVRNMIPRLWIDRTKCGEAFEVLKQYRAEWDDKNMVLGRAPKHDHSSNFADSLRYFAVTRIHNGEWTEIDYSYLDQAVKHG